ncbi:inositol polyphosphate 5-phosphatase K isoform X4 [Siniperca chuatsi]|uniref:inositol polyphosphate 5-phosphatase K isoform X4 n=1 Tax=Siniperca chuatsi TaxID=119488 RepID=UPI001CE1FDFB|nr:inositol polyphosphate 5-phosphatase K isoform X4 [Siniperca chuatsi]
MDLLTDSPRVRSDSMSSSASQGSRSKMLLRQRLSQLLTCIEDMSSDDEASEEVSRTLDEAFQLCGRFIPTDAFRLHMVTWNVATAEPPEDVTSLLQLEVQPPTDLYVIGLQEVNATPVRFISDLLVEDSWSHVFMDTLAPRGFVKVTSMRMQGLLLLVFAKQIHLPYIRNIQTTYTRTGIFGYWGNKGGVSVRFSFYGHMVCFLNCHLAAHMNYALQRVDEFEYILEAQDFDISDTPHVLDHNGKKRKPAWTDRILWRIKPKTPPSEDDDEKASTSTDDGLDEYPLLVTQDKYTSDMSYGVSDHKPVIATFSLELRKCFDTPMVHISTVGVWSADHDALLNYTIQEDFMSSTWDWIGLYKVGFKSASDYETFVWVREDELPETNEVIQISVDKDEIPLLGGQYVLGYYSTNMQSIIGLSANFQILESKRAIMEGLVPENINGLNK